MTWFSYALLGACTFTAYTLLIRTSLKGQGDAKVFALLMDVVAGILLLGFILFDDITLVYSLQTVLLLVLVSVFFVFFNILFIRGRQLEEVSNVAIIRQTETIWVFLGGIVLLHEVLTGAKLLGVLLILLGSVVVLWSGRTFHLTRGIIYVFLSAIFVSGTSLIGKVLVENTISPALYSAVQFLLGAMIIFLFLSHRVKRIKKELKLQQKNLLYVGALLAVSVYFLMKAYQLGEASRVMPVYSSSMILSVLAGIFVLREKSRMRNKIIGTVIGFIGLLLLRP